VEVKAASYAQVQKVATCTDVRAYLADMRFWSTALSFFPNKIISFVCGKHIISQFENQGSSHETLPGPSVQVTLGYMSVHLLLNL
jgi:hypothetical protein